VNRGFDVCAVASAAARRCARHALGDRGCGRADRLAAWPLYTQSRKELAPIEDQSHIAMFMQAAPDASLQAVHNASLDVIASVREMPEAEFMWSLSAPWGGFGGMVAKNWKERSRSTEEMYGELYGAVSQVAGLRVFPRLDPPLPTPGQYDVELVLQSDAPPEQLLETVGAIVGAGWQSGKFLYVDTDLKIDLPQASVVLDRDRIADLGLDLAGVGRELGTLLGGGYVNRFNYFDYSYKVIPQIAAEDRATVEPLLDLKIRTPGGDLVPVSTFTRIETSAAPRTLNRFQQRNAVRVFGGVQPGVTKDEGLRVLEDAVRRQRCRGSVSTTRRVATDPARGQRPRDHARLRADSHLSRAVGAVPQLPRSADRAAGLRAARDLGRADLQLSRPHDHQHLLAGRLITLVGLIAKNGILIVEFANTLQERGMAKLDALREASATRLRPVLMTSAATVFGHMPLVFVSVPAPRRATASASCSSRA
jgi:multidrug efflux pump